MKNKHTPGATLWILLFFMTVLLCFPFIFYWKLATTGSDLLRYNRSIISNYGFDLQMFFEGRLSSADTAAEDLSGIPLIPEIGVELYDIFGTGIAERNNFSGRPHPKSPLLYRMVKSVIDAFRNNSGGNNTRSSLEVRQRLLQSALAGESAADYIFISGGVGDRYLYFSYPIKLRLGSESPVVGALLIESRDTSAGYILQKQRNQYAAVFLVFSIFLAFYVFYALRFIILPLRKVVIKSSALNRGTAYLYPDANVIRRRNEIGELSLQLDHTAGLIKQREDEFKRHMSALKHIIRNPLAVIRTAVEALMMGKKDGQELSLSGIIYSNLARIDDYISSYSPVSELIESSSKPEDIDLNSFLKDIVKNYSALAKKKDVRFVFSEVQPVPVWRGFYAELFYALEQIINNAIDFSPPKASILLEILPSEEDIAVLVSDQGPGIEDGRNEEIFAQHASFRTSAQSKHTGTGLYLSRSVLRRIGGEITARNNPDAGAVFTITLPLRR